MRQRAGGSVHPAAVRAHPLLLLLFCALLVGCAPAPVAPAPPQEAVATLAPEVAGDPAALVAAERAAASARDLTTLAALWAEDAQIVEHRGPGTDDDYRWLGRDAILDRYVVAVFPNPPPPLDAPADLRPVITGERATLENGVDRWSFERSGGRWWISALEIGRPE
jgi:hypothetical protein